MNPYRLLSSPWWPALAALAVAPSLCAAPAFPLKVSENRPPNTAPADRNAVHTAARPGGMMADSPVTFPKQGALPAKYPPDVKDRAEPSERDYYIFSTPCRSLAQIAAIQRDMPPGRFTPPPADWAHLQRTRLRLTEGGDLRLLALGDSIVNDTMRSGWVAQLQEAYPKARIQATVCVRGGGGCQHYREEGRVEKYLWPRKPDLVYIGGISQKDIASIREVIHQLRAGLPDVEILLATGTFGTADPRDAAALAKAPHSGTGAYGHALRSLAAEERCAYLDMTGPWAEYIRSANVHPHWFYRDVVHANEFGEQILARIMMAFWTALPTVAPADEEFVGPFPSWRDAQRDYGARGDGQADDTTALQRALDELAPHTNSCVLYLPAGTYRLTGMLQTVRKAHTDCQGVAIIGEDPARTILRWDGTNGGTMFQWDAWYSKISRLTFDGAGRAGTALLYGPAFSTYNESSDLIFRDASNGLVFGGPTTQGQAENAVLRCQFFRCGIGLQTVNWNSMDIWVWHGRFEDCGRGVHNVMGNWHVWESLFLRSRLADLSSINLMAFSVVNNTSLGSRCFFDFSTGHTWGSPVSLTGNRVLDPTGDWAVLLDNAGPYLVADNQFRLTGAARGIRMTWADQTLVGNTYSKTNAVEERGRFRRLAEQVVPADEISEQIPSLPPTPPRRQRRIFEIPANADASTIQQALNEAAQLAGQRPVVHLPMGNYKVAKTIVIPAGCDLQLIGDSAGETGTRLNWTGPNDGVVLRVEGPSHATLRDFYIHAGGARALLVENCDQPRGRIFADQLNANGPGAKGSTNAAALRVSGLDHTDVLLRALQGSGHAGRWVEVLGGPEAGRATNQMSIFTGATGSAAGQYEVRQGGRLVVRGVYHERSSDSLNGLRLADRGILSIDATRFSYATSPAAPTVAADNFRGLFTLATCMLLPVETKSSCRFELRGDGSDTSVLALNNQFWIEQKTTADDVWRNVAHPPARGGLVGCNVNTGKKEAAPTGFEFLANIGDHPDPAKSASGAGPLDHRGTVDDATLLRHLAPLRTARVWWPDDSVPGTATDLRIHRVMAGGGRGAVVELRARR